MRRIGLVILTASALAALIATAARAHSTPQIRAEQAHERQVQAEVDQIGNHLQQIEDQAWSARQRLVLVEQSLKSNTYKLRLARANFHAAQQRIMARLYSLYVDGKPSTLEVIAGAKSLSQLIDRAEAANVISRQDSALGQQALQFQQAVTKRHHQLKQLRRQRAQAVLSLISKKREVQAALEQQRRLLASIHMTVHQLQVKEAEHERELRAERLRELQAEQAAAAAAAQQQQNEFPSIPSIPPIFGTGAGHPEAARIALQYLGVPYVWGGASPSGFDCSGLVMYVYAQLGISLPHYTFSQLAVTEPISESQLEPGDLVFFYGGDHVGIYIGNGEFVNAPHTGSVVRIDSLASWGGTFYAARRVP
jgi:cell wall-associated NlpC family hydrolase